MAKKKTGPQTMGEVLDAAGIKRTAFGEAVGWVKSTIPMKLNRKRNWTVAEYEAAFAVAKKYRLGLTREDMQRFATKRGEAADAEANKVSG